MPPNLSQCSDDVDAHISWLVVVEVDQLVEVIVGERPRIGRTAAHADG